MGRADIEAFLSYLAVDTGYGNDSFTGQPFHILIRNQARFVAEFSAWTGFYAGVDAVGELRLSDQLKIATTSRLQ